MILTQSDQQKKRLDKSLQIAVLIYQAIAVIAFIIIPIAATNWWKTPFIGAFVEQTMIFNGVGPTREQSETDAWALFNSGVKLRDQLAQVDGQKVNNVTDLQQALASHSEGEKLSVTYITPDGAQHSTAIQLSIFPQTDRVTYFFIPYFVGFIYLAISLWIVILRRTESAGRAFVLFASSLAIGAGGLFDVYTTHYLTVFWTLAVALAGGALFDLSLSFPQEFSFTADRPYLRWFGYLAALALAVMAVPDIYNLSQPTNYIQKWQFIYGFTGLAFIFFSVVLVIRRYTDKSPVAQQQIRMVWWGILLSFAPLGIWLFISFFASMNFNPYLFVPTVMFPIVTGYAILRYRLLKIDYLVSRGALIILLTVMTTLGYGLVIGGLSLILGKTIPANNPWAVGALIGIVALGGQMVGNGYIDIKVPGVFPDGLPCIATGAVAGIVLNAIFLLVPPEKFGVVTRDNLNL